MLLVRNLLAFLLLQCLVTNASLIGSKRFISVPLTKIHRDSAHELPAILHQQHVNRGLRRYARMTGSSEPTLAELRENIVDRLSTIPPASLQKRFYRGGVNKILEHLHLNTSFLFTSTGAGKGGQQGKPTNIEPYGQAHNSTLQPASIPLAIEAHDFGYFGSFFIGTPPKLFQILIDSGSADFWVGGEGCHDDSGGSCGNHTFLGPGSSTTYKDVNQTWSIEYGTGAVSGRMVQDSISVAGLHLPNMTFGTALTESSDFTSDQIPFDGLIGFAKSQILSRQGVPTLVEAMASAGVISQPIVSYKISRSADHRNDGELTLGGMDSSKFNPKTLVTVKNQSRLGFWEAALDAIHVNGVDMGWKNRTLILDTGTTLMIAPAKDVTAIHAAIPGAKKDGHTWTVPCNLKTPVSFTISGRVFPIDPRDIAFIPMDQNNPTGTCMSGISEGNPGLVDSQWLIGNVFLKNVYFSTDAATDQISFAKST